MEIPIFNTYIDKSSNLNVNNVLESTYLSEGALVKEFESRLSNELNIVNPVAVNSGTSALHLSLILAGVGPGDEVIIPAQTFIATGLVVLQQGAIPVFADIDYETGNICCESVKSKITAKTKAIIVVHWGGYPCEMDDLVEISKINKLILIEDAAHALGANYKGRQIGSISDYTCFSFQAIKHLTTGDGGLIACKSSFKADEAIQRRWFGINRSESKLSNLGERIYDLNLLGFKYHMNDYAAALGISNLVSFKKRLQQRLDVAKFYDEELSSVSGIKLFKYSKQIKSSYWLYGFHVENRDEFINHMKKNGVATSVVHQRIDKYKIFGGIRHDLINQLKFDESQIHIPIHEMVDLDVAKKIVDNIKQGWI